MAHRAKSKVRLTSFCVYKVDSKTGAIEILAGASDARLAANGSIELLADSVPYHAKSFKGRQPKHGCGILMLYGARDALDEMQFWRMHGREQGAQFASAEFEVEIGEIEVGLTDRELLKKMAGTQRFLNFRRMRASLQSQVLMKFSEYAEEAGLNINEEMSRVSQIAAHPEFFDRLLKEDPDLSRLDVFVIPVADDPNIQGRVRSVAYVKPGAKILSESQSNELAKIILPSWMN